MTDQLSLRHTLATLAYRAAKPLRDAPPEFSSFRIGDSGRTAGQILAHLCDLMSWALSISKGSETWHNSEVHSWAEDSERFFAAVSALDQYLASGEELHTAPEKLFQGAIADSLTHVGQLAMLRRLAGSKIRGENYFVANIEAGRTTASQNPAVREFD